MVRGMKRERSLPEKWLWLGVAALAIAGLFAVLLVVARTPQLKDLPVVQSLFNVALVVHVDLSVLLWFLAAGCMGWSALITKHGGEWPFWQRGAFYTVAAATACIALSPLSPHWTVVQSNYIPMLLNLPFMLGLGLMMAGIGALLIQLLGLYLAPKGRAKLENYTEAGMLYAGVATLMALVMFALSAATLPPYLDAKEHFERLFWNGGHMLQISYTILMMAAWIGLQERFSGKVDRNPFLFVCYALTLFAAMASCWGLVIYAPHEPDAIQHQTWVMKYLMGNGAALLSVYVIWRMFKDGLGGCATRAYASSLLSSLTLFIAGGTLGMMISGQNVTIPAHYHGQIVCVTLALMGLAYAMLPRFGYQSVAHTRLAFWQPIVYGFGQLLHIGGLAYSGGYGVLRKTAGGFDKLEPAVKAALGVMGLGGMIAIIGGILFVIVMLRAKREPSASHQG